MNAPYFFLKQSQTLYYTIKYTSYWIKFFFLTYAKYLHYLIICITFFVPTITEQDQLQSYCEYSVAKENPLLSFRCQTWRNSRDLNFPAMRGIFDNRHSRSLEISFASFRLFPSRKCPLWVVKGHVFIRLKADIRLRKV